jgi:hypothetical protein
VPRGKRNQIAEDKVTAADVIAFIERTCFIPEGKFVGQQLKLFDWQKDLLRLIYDNPHGTRRAIISMGRKGGKTSLSACLLLEHLCGPRGTNRTASFTQPRKAATSGHYLFLGGEHGPTQSGAGARCDHSGDGKITHLSGAGDAISGFERRCHHGYGLSPQLVIHDELGLVRGPRSPLFEALETATGAQEDPLSIIISTQAATDADLLSVLIDDALAGNDPHTVVKLYTSSLSRLL